MSRLNLNIPDELHKRFKAICALEGKEMTEVVVRIVQEYVEKAEKKLKK
jgi:metal-responsive CopG/Arc/MetJ family transcriptional regulator